MNLTPKQKAFADYYIETGNATESAIKAGYSKKTAYSIGEQNLKKLEVKKYIDERMKQIESDRIADAKEVMEYLTSVMRGQVEEEVVVVEGEGEGCSSARRVRKEVSPKDRNKAAELIGKRYALFTEKLQVDNSAEVEKVKKLDNIASILEQMKPPEEGG